MTATRTSSADVARGAIPARSRSRRRTRRRARRRGSPRCVPRAARSRSGDACSSSCSAIAGAAARGRRTNVHDRPTPRALSSRPRVRLPPGHRPTGATIRTTARRGIRSPAGRCPVLPSHPAGRARRGPHRRPRRDRRHAGAATWGSRRSRRCRRAGVRSATVRHRGRAEHRSMQDGRAPRPCELDCGPCEIDARRDLSVASQRQDVAPGAASDVEHRSASAVDDLAIRNGHGTDPPHAVDHVVLTRVAQAGGAVLVAVHRAIPSTRVPTSSAASASAKRGDPAARFATWVASSY